MLAIAPSMANAKTHGNYPALTDILSCVFEGSLVDIDTALKIEARISRTASRRRSPRT